MTPAARPPILLVGAGLMGRWHADALRRLSLSLEGVVDVDERQASSVAAKFPQVSVYGSVEEALSSGKFSAAHVCTPVGSHHEMIERLLEAGVHVLCEKPLTDSAESTEELLECAAVKDLLLVPVHQFLFQRGFESALDAVADGGGLLHADFFAASAGAVGGDSRRADSVVADILPHPLSLLRRMVGPVFDSIEWSAVSSAGELRASGRWGRATVGILISMHGRPTRNAARFVCERGTAHVDLFHGFGWREGPAVSRRTKITRPFLASVRSGAAATGNLAHRALAREPAYPGLRTLTSLFHRSVESGAPAPIAPEEVLGVARTRDVILARAHEAA